MSQQCPCHSMTDYNNCCNRYHQGERPDNALLLMRSRYAAYALQFVSYIIETTHPLNPHYRLDQEPWAAEILRFSQVTTFENLEILSFTDGLQKGSVTFRASLKQQGKDISFTEQSYFEKVSDKWLYLKGLIS
jgi:SEC-C motif domain protein